MIARITATLGEPTPRRHLVPQPSCTAPGRGPDEIRIEIQTEPGETLDDCLTRLEVALQAAGVRLETRL